MDLVSWTLTSQTADIDKPVLLDSADPSRCLSFRDVRTYVRKLVSGLHAAGIQPGDCVCLSSFNDIFYYVLYLGIIGAGAKFTGTNPAYTSHEMVHHLQMTGAKALIVEPKLLNSALSAAKECGLPLSRVFVLDLHESNPRDDLSSWNALLQHGEADWVSVADPDNTVASIASTSGTSGLPKGAFLSHSYHVTQASMRNGDELLPYEVRRLTALPPFHVFATPIVPSSLRGGHPTYIMRRFDMSQYIEAIEKYQISEIWVPPPVLTGIPKSALATQTTLRSLRQIWMGGGAVNYANQLPMYNLMDPSARIYQVWGMTEAGWVTTTVWPEKQFDDTVGRPLPGFELRIVDDDDKEVGNKGEIGNILIKSPHLMKGYIGNEKATQETFTSDGWLRSGDVGYFVDGKCYIIDRKKELLKVRGWQVSPAEVEGALLQHPDVTDAAVIGVPTDDTEIPRAYVVRKPDSKLTEPELKAFVSQRLARYKVPEEFVFTESIPKNSTGKILRRVLRENLQQERKNIPTSIIAKENTSRSWQGRIAMFVKSSKELSKGFRELLTRIYRRFQV